MSMFCYQCEQTAKGTGCTMQGVCGKTEAAAKVQDLLLYLTKGISMYAHRAGELGARDRDADVFVIKALFTTVTNVNFDPERLAEMVRAAVEIRKRVRLAYEVACEKAGKTPEALDGPAAFMLATDMDGMLAQAEKIGVAQRITNQGAEITGLQELVTYGLKGAAAYIDHAHILGKDDDTVFAEFHALLDSLTKPNQTTEPLLSMALKAGEVNLKAMELLDAANTESFGHPVPTQVRVEPVKGKAILVSGHDLLDLEELLKQTEGKGINAYTHGEMLPAHGYPKLKACRHLVGNYGGAWQNQTHEFDEFPGAILMTTNCVQKPRSSYEGRIFTTGLVEWPGVVHVSNPDFTPVINAALASEGFTEDGAERYITVGFGHQAVMSVADKVIEAVNSGAIKHFFLVGGCDGAKMGRNYYTDLARAVPQDSVILTLACGKYRFNKLEFGDIGGIPRLLDIGQCNDAYSAIQIAVALSKSFGVGVNELPLSLVLSWYEQKAVAILLTLLHLGITNIRLGPSLPAFLTPNVLNVLMEKFQIAPISTPEDDLKAILGG